VRHGHTSRDGIAFEPQGSPGPYAEGRAFRVCGSGRRDLLHPDNRGGAVEPRRSVEMIRRGDHTSKLRLHFHAYTAGALIFGHGGPLIWDFALDDKPQSPLPRMG